MHALQLTSLCFQGLIAIDCFIGVRVCVRSPKGAVFAIAPCSMRRRVEGMRGGGRSMVVPIVVVGAAEDLRDRKSSSPRRRSLLERRLERTLPRIRLDGSVRDAIKKNKLKTLDF